MKDYNQYLDAVLAAEKPRQPDEFTGEDVAKRMGRNRRAAYEWVLSRFRAGELTRRRVGRYYLYKPAEPGNGQGKKKAKQP